VPATSTTSKPAKSGEPNTAVLLSWVIPGAGHVYLGQVRVGLLCFLVVEGLYWLGVKLSHGMFLEYLPPEMRSTFAAALTPEAGNLGALFLHQRAYGFGPGEPRPWPATMDLGTLCTAASGVLNVFVMSSASFVARSGERPRGRALHPAVAACWAWIVPGLGHLVQRRGRRALLAGLSLVGLFVLGTFLAQGSNLDRERHFYYWSGQFLLGLPAVFAELVHGHAPVTADIPYADAGVVIACLAGMLNVLCMLDVYSWSEDRSLAKASAEKVLAKVEAEPAALGVPAEQLDVKVDSRIP
jgi:TM2 domain-containing membrane protein YozV